MKSIIFNQHQVNHALKDKEGMFRVVVKPQIKSDINPVYLKEIGAWQWATKESRRKPKFEVEETIFVKESWNKDQGVIYKADSLEANVEWISANYMSKWASRLILRIKSVKVERLQDISEEDAIAQRPQYSIIDPFRNATPIDLFKILWNCTHKKLEEKWEANPWVWCYEYEVVR